MSYEEPKIFGLSAETLADGFDHLYNDICKPLGIITLIVIDIFLYFWIFWYLTGGPIYCLNVPCPPR